MCFVCCCSRHRCCCCFLKLKELLLIREVFWIGKLKAKKKKKAKRENSERGHRSRTYACASAHLLLTVSKSDFARDTPARTVISPPQVAKFAFVVAVDSTAFAVSQQPR